MGLLSSAAGHTGQGDVQDKSPGRGREVCHLWAQGVLTGQSPRGGGAGVKAAAGDAEAKEGEDFRMRTWEAETFTSGSLEEPRMEGHGVAETSPRTAAVACGAVRVPRAA